jgi:hypothetical protein
MTQHYQQEDNMPSPNTNNRSETWLSFKLSQEQDYAQFEVDRDGGALSRLCRKYVKDCHSMDKRHSQRHCVLSADALLEELLPPQEKKLKPAQRRPKDPEHDVGALKPAALKPTAAPRTTLKAT